MLDPFFPRIVIPWARMNAVVPLNKTDADDDCVGGVPKGFEHRLSKWYEVVKRE